MPIRPTTSLVIALAASAASYAQVDSVVSLVPQTIASGASTASNPGTIFGLAYDPTSDTMFTVTSNAVDTTARVRKIANVSTAPVATNLFLANDLNTWLQKGESRTGTGLPQGLAFNPATVGSIGAAGGLWFSDGPSITQIGNSTVDPVASARVYRYNLQPVPTSGPTVFANLNQVLTVVANRQDKANAAGVDLNTTNPSEGLTRNLSFSPDGQSIYILEPASAGALSGIYRVDPVNPGVVTKLPTPLTAGMNMDAGVTKNGALDRVWYRSSTNPNGLNYVDHNPTTNTTAAETVALTVDQIKAFLETTTTPTVVGVSGDSAGNVYLNITTSGGSADAFSGRVLKLDTAGRLVKVASRTERANALGLNATGSALGSIPNTAAKMSTYAYIHATAGPIARVLYSETFYGVSAINVFKPLDLDRDGDEDQLDRNAMLAKLGLRGASSVIADARYDLNGNGVIDWKDVKILQTFAPGIRDGDANMDGAVDFGDLNILRDNYLGTGKTWATGDFASLVAGSDTYLSNAADANVTNYVDLETLANTWLNVLSLPAPTFAQLDANDYTGRFRDDVIAAFNVVPEPGTLGLLGAGALAMTRRRRV